MGRTRRRRKGPDNRNGWTRREFIKTGAASGAGLYLVSRLGLRPRLFAQPLPGGTIDPAAVQKYAMPLIVPPVMPRTAVLPMSGGRKADYFEIAVQQFGQQILPPPYPQTTVWSYGSANHPGSFNYPAFTIEARWRQDTRVKWINGLFAADGSYLPHLLPVDQTLHWANPPGGEMGRDMRGSDPTRYMGPVPIVTHVHGAHVTDESDGYAEAWFLPNAKNIPGGYAKSGSWYEFFKAKFLAMRGVAWAPGTATFQYANDQAATTLWYHDHSLGMTRLNVYAGPAGFYLLRGGPDEMPPETLPGPPPALGDLPGTRYYEIPIAIQDRSFNNDGSLFYPDGRAFFEGLERDQLQIPFIPSPACDGEVSDVSPIWNPEFFGNTMVVNGRTWPSLEVEARRYRFRLLNGCNSRFLTLKIVSGDPTHRPATAALPFWQIGAEEGFLQAPLMLERLLMAPAERADVIVDFSALRRGTELFLINEGPDEPFGGGEPPTDFPWADPETTGQVMRFTVVRRRSPDKSVPPARLVLPVRTPLPAAENTRQVSIHEHESRTVRVITDTNGAIILACDDPDAMPFGPTSASLGVIGPDGKGIPLKWMEAVTEDPNMGATEIWEIHNFTEDAHPIHIHQVAFEVVNRETGGGHVRAPEAWESGRKDTVIAYPGEITRVKATFDLPGQYVWHCHIVEHEDNEMMRPYRVGPPQPGEPV